MGLLPRKKEKSLPMSYQAKRLVEDYPKWKVSYSYNNLIAIGKIKPTILSPDYTIQLAYSLKDSIPQITLLSPEMKLRDGKLPPHLLDKEKRSLCLCYPKLKEWKKTDLIIQMIIPRISLWLFYYEHWLAYGKWLGGGTVHFKNKPLEIKKHHSF